MKRIIVLLMCVLLLGGCTPSAPSGPTETPSGQPNVDNSLKDQQAQDAFSRFLSDGECRATTDATLGYDDMTGNLDGLEYGDYTYADLLEKAADSVMCDVKAMVAYVDLGHTGVRDMVLRFVPENPSFMNLNAVLHYDGNKLIISASYYDGYRVLSELFNDGHLGIYAADGAGIYMNNYYQFDENGRKSLLFARVSYDGYLVPVIFNSLSKSIDQNYADILGSQNNLSFSVEEYKTSEDYKGNSSIKVAVTQWDDNNPTLLAIEQKLIEDLKSVGAEVISVEEMDKLCDVSAMKNSGLVEYKSLSSDPKPVIENDPKPVTNNDTVTIHAVYRQEDINNIAYNIKQSQDVTIGDGPYDDAVIIYADQPLKYVRVHVIEVESYDKEGGANIIVTEQWAGCEEVTLQYPLLVNMDLHANPIKIAISYEKADGQREYLSMSLVGEEEELFLSPFKPVQIYY